MNKTKLLTAILGLSIAGNAALGLYTAKLNEDVDIAYRVADDMAAEAKDAQEIVEGKDYAVSADDGGFSFDPAATDAKPGDRISVTFTKDQYENGSGFKAIKVIE